MRPTFFSILADDEHECHTISLFETLDDIDVKYPYGHGISNIVRREIHVPVENITNAVKYPLRYAFWCLG